MLSALKDQFSSEIEFVDEVPQKRSNKEGVLLLGSHHWLEQLGTLPEKNIYVTPMSIEQGQSIPIGLSFVIHPRYIMGNGQI